MVFISKGFSYLSIVFKYLRLSFHSVTGLTSFLFVIFLLTYQTFISVIPSGVFYQLGLISERPLLVVHLWPSSLTRRASLLSFLFSRFCPLTDLMTFRVHQSHWPQVTQSSRHHPRSSVIFVHRSRSTSTLSLLTTYGLSTFGNDTSLFCKIFDCKSPARATKCGH